MPSGTPKIDTPNVAPIRAHLVLDEFTSGNTAKRFVVGFGAGRSTVDARLVFQGEDGKELASTRIRVRGNLAWGAYQGRGSSTFAGGQQFRRTARGGNCPVAVKDGSLSPTKPLDSRALPVDFATIVEGLRLAILVFRGNSLAYQNPAAASLTARLRKQYHVDLLVILRDHLARVSRRHPRVSPRRDSIDSRLRRILLRPCRAARVPGATTKI